MLAVLLVSVALVAGCGEEYTLEGPTWASVDPLYYDIDAQAGENTQLAWSDAVADWNTAGTPANFEADPDNYVVFLSEFDGDAEGWEDYKGNDGLTQSWLNPEGDGFVFCMGLLNIRFTDSDWYSSLARRSVAGHELGHVLGLDEFDGEVLMNQQTAVRFFELGIYAPQQGDIDGVNAMYG
jgi:hypothetical protein